MIKPLLINLAAILISSVSAAQCNGTVNGTVLDEAGVPEAGADVSMMETGLYHYSKGLVTFPTDRSGMFHAHVERPGTYVFGAGKEADGHPSPWNSFYGVPFTDKIVLDCQSHISGIIVRLGPKTGYLAHISVTDAATGKPIPAPTITLRRAEAEDLFMSTSSTRLNLPIPSDKDVIYQISAEGYISSPRTTIRLAPSEHMDIRVALSPTP